MRAVRRVVQPVGRVVQPVGRAVRPVGRVVEPVAGRVASALTAGARSVPGRAASLRGALGGRRQNARRRLRALARQPLPNLYDLHPEARSATPRELGLRFVPLDEIRGTAVAGVAQRGGDFLPLPPFRSGNWQSRWQRIVKANAALRPLPPVDLVKYDGGYWVVDGHNRVAAALYDGAAGLDAIVTELVPLDGHMSETPVGVLALRADDDALREAVFESTNRAREDNAAEHEAHEEHESLGERN